MNRMHFTPAPTALVPMPTTRDIERVRAYVETESIVSWPGDPPFTESLRRVLAVCEAVRAERASAEALVSMSFATPEF